ncbi:uncharacterized protein TNCV_4490001 [Trichonephila clavipes]|nr:uncharacterized protein TNCV_4490001 [Trichonephila clavipes]
MDQEIQMIKDGLAARKEELATTLGEIALINCSIVDCPTQTNRTNQSDSGVTNQGTKNTDNEINPKPSNDKNNTLEKVCNIKSINVKNDKDNSKNKNKRTGQEDFKTPNKFARKTIEIPTEKVICTIQNKFAVLDDA